MVASSDLVLTKGSCAEQLLAAEVLVVVQLFDGVCCTSSLILFRTAAAATRSAVFAVGRSKTKLGFLQQF
jgi:hypothetical protein